ncbi:MAG: hypothetical protein R6V29_09355 [Spirochaetia bacterium]
MAARAAAAPAMRARAAPRAAPPPTQAPLPIAVLRLFLLLTAFCLTGFLFFTAPAHADGVSTTPSPPQVVIPTPEPFTLSAYDALHARAMMHRVGFVQLWDGENDRETVAVRDVETVKVGENQSLPPAHRARYDLRLNGEMVDWDHTYIQYGGRMVSLQLLFTYRNQHPPDDLRYTGDDYSR